MSGFHPVLERRRQRLEMPDSSLLLNHRFLQLSDEFLLLSLHLVEAVLVLVFQIIDLAFYLLICPLDRV